MVDFGEFSDIIEVSVDIVECVICKGIWKSVVLKEVSNGSIILFDKLDEFMVFFLIGIFIYFVGYRINDFFIGWLVRVYVDGVFDLFYFG